MAKTIVQYNLKELNTALITTFAASTAINQAQDLPDLTEQIPDADMPLIQIYPNGASSALESETIQNTFGGTIGQKPVQRLPFTFNIDVYIGQRSLLAENMGLYVEVFQIMNDILNGQTLKPLFGHPAIQAFTWEGERVIITYSNVNYLAIRYTIDLEVF